MSPKERDDELIERYLQGDSELSRIYRRHADEQPDAALDARILAEAHRAVARDARVAHSPFARNWMVPTSLAAVLVLSVSIVLLMPDPALDTGLDDGLAGEPAALRSAPEPKRERAPGRLETDADSRQDAAGEAVGGAPGRLAPSAAQPADQAPAAPAEKRKASSAEQRGIESGDLESRPAAPAAAATEEAKRGLQQEMHELEEAKRRLQQDRRKLEEAEPSAAEAAPSSRDVTGTMQKAAVAGTRDPDPKPRAGVRADPAAWLAFIEELAEAQDIDGAKSNLRAFRRQYPDYPLPRSLAPLAASMQTQSE